MKSPSRRLRRLVGAGTAALLAAGLAPILTSGVAQAASTNTPAIAVANQTVIGVGQSGSAAGAMVIGSSTTTFNAGDQITVQVTQPGVGTPAIAPGPPAAALAAEMNPNCNGGSTGLGTDVDSDPTLASGAGDRRFVAYAATPTAAGPAGGTLTLLPGVPGSSTPAGTGGTIPGFCNSQDGGTKIDIYTFVVATTGTGPIAIDNIKYDVGRGTGLSNNAGATTRAHSTTTGPVRQYVFFTNVTTAVTTLFKLSTANQALAGTGGTAAVGKIGDSNAWITTLGMTGPPKSFAVTTGSTATKTISGITISEFVTDAFGVAGTANNTFCIDIATGNATFAASPSLSVTGSGLATDLLQSIVVPDSTGPGGPNTRVSITIFNNPANVLSSLTLNNLVLNIGAATVGSVRAILTDCGDTAGPGGSLPGTNADTAPPIVLPAPFPQPVAPATIIPDAFGGALSTGAVVAPLPAGNDGPPGGIGPNAGTGPAVNDFFTSTNAGGFNSIGSFSGPNDSVNDLNRVVIFFLLLADRSGGNDRVATARILQQEKYGLSGVNITVNLLTGQITNPTSGIPCTTDQSILDSRELQVVQNQFVSVCGGTRIALVATADNFPDALSASYAAGRIHAAIYLVRPTVDALAQVQLGLQGLGVKTVLVLGGPAAVPDTVVDFLKGLNTSCTTDSLCGSNPNGLTNGDSRVAPGTKLVVARIQDPLNDTRYGTMRLLNILTGLPVSIPVVVQQVQPALFNATKQVAPASPANVCAFCRTAFVVSGANFPDALSAGVRAYAQGIPMILTDPAALSPEAAQTLKDLQTQQVVIVGGEAAVSAAVADSLTKATQDGGLGLVVARVSGADRLATAVEVMKYSSRNPANTSLPGLGLTNLTTVLLARGDTFPDSLTAAVQGIGSLVGVRAINGGFGTGADPNKLNYGGNASILLTVDPTHLGASTQAQLVTVGGGTNGLSSGVNAIKCLGLQAAISDATCTAAQSALAGITT